MTRKEALELSLEVWGCLAAHPEISEKSDLPKDLYGRIENMVFGCPLCELYNTAENRSCFGCPLFFDGRKDPVKCSDIQHPYIKWAHAASKRRRKRYATAIVKLLEAALEKENRNEESN